MERLTSTKIGYLTTVLKAYTLIFLIFVTVACCSVSPLHDKSVVLIVMDGLRHDYLELTRAHYGPDSLPNFGRFEANGIRASRSINVFPTKTLPNYQTLLTGLYPIFHGVVNDFFRDSHWPEETFAFDNQDSLNDAPWLDNWPEPIWVTLQKSGRLVGSMLWPLTDGAVKNQLPFKQVSQFDAANFGIDIYPTDRRVDDVLQWLTDENDKVDFIMLFLNGPDVIGHVNGPNSIQVKESVQQLDSVLGRLLDGLETYNLTNNVDIILTSDHGMTDIKLDRRIVMDDYVDPTLYEHTQFSVFGLIYPLPDKDEEVYNKMKSAHESLKVYWLSDVPAELHYRMNTSRMPPIVLIPDEGWYLVHTSDESIFVGDHGYPAEQPDMNPFFMASGPSFRAGEQTDDVHALDVYPLMCQLLDIPPNQHNGSLSRIAKRLLKPQLLEQYSID